PSQDERKSLLRLGPHLPSGKTMKGSTAIFRGTTWGDKDRGPARPPGQERVLAGLRQSRKEMNDGRSRALDLREIAHTGGSGPDLEADFGNRRLDRPRALVGLRERRAMGAATSSKLQPAIGFYLDGSQDSVPGHRTILGIKPPGTFLRLGFGLVLQA